MKDDVEILEINDEFTPKKSINKNNNVKLSERKVNKKVVKRVRKGKVAQFVFCLVSFLFILGCCVYYGSRLIKYYKIYNPKIDSSGGGNLLAQDIIGNYEYDPDSDSGLFNSSGNYFYKGNVNNNYLKFNNLLWRIVRINMDNSIEIILDDYINIMPWSNGVTSFKKSEIYDYLNSTFLNNIDKDMLAKVSFCEEIVTDLSKISCGKQDSDSYVKLLDLTNFLNSVKNKKTYLVSDDEVFWLSDYNTDKIWHVNGVNASLSSNTSLYEVRPVVKLKNTVNYTKGDGTKDNPYLVGESEKPSLGSIVKLGDDNYIIYDIGNEIKLVSEKVLEKTYAFDKEKLVFDVESKNSLAEYLNTTYLDSLSYKDLLVDTTWYTGSYKNSLNDIKKDEIKAKVSVPSLLDLKPDSSVKGYFMTTSNDENMLVYENPIRISKPTTNRNVRVCVAISKTTFNKLKYNNGVFEVK